VKKWLVLIVAASLFLSGCTAVLLRKAWPVTSGKIEGLPVSAPVEVLRDSYGIPHITAANEHDLYVAQGFVHAQDRLWQMESLRRLTEGRLSEIAGESTVAVDFFARMTGMPALKRAAYSDMAVEDRGRLEAYAEGVNACLRQRGRDLPLEFRSLRFIPEPWTALDCTSLLPYMAFGLLYPSYAEELFALARGGSFTQREWDDLFPTAPGAKLPAESFFDTIGRRKIGAINPSAFVFHLALPDSRTPTALAKSLISLGSPGSGSNNWAVARGSKGLPLLANDPHLAVALPPVWYFCHLTVPGKLNVAGASLAGCPGIVIGRNEHVAWGMTNDMIDAVDILVFDVDAKDPTRYRVGGRERAMQREDVKIALPKGRSVTLPLWRTTQGPVITALEPGVEAAAVLKWYGTLPLGALHDHTYRGVFSFMEARSAREVLDDGRVSAYAGQNLLAADDQGHIGWHAYGAAPVRAGYTGRLPADGSAGADWKGFLPYDSLPHRFDPPQGWLATANNPPQNWAGPALSYAWAPIYRWQRIGQVVSGMTAPSVEDFRRLQMDTHSLQADRLLPKLLAYHFPDGTASAAAARTALRLLGEWDHEVRPESRGAAVYEVFLDELVRALLSDDLGEDLALYLNAKGYGIEDEILDRPDSPLWDRKDTPERETPRQILETALANTMKVCTQRMGRNTDRWSWGRLHGYVFKHPGATNRLYEMLLDRGPFPAPGDDNTVNVSWSLAARGSYDATTIPSMRMIAAPGDPDGLWLAEPLGQSGQPGHPHYDDMMKPYLAGDLVLVPLTPDGVKRVAKDILVLAP
jgi:penicillin G amidase